MKFFFYLFLFFYRYYQSWLPYKLDSYVYDSR